MQIANIFIGLFGTLLSLFIYWKRMKEDYSSDIIFQSATYVYLFIFFLYLISSNLLKPYFFWFILTGLFAGIYFGSLKLKFRFFEGLESMVISFLPYFSLVFLKNSVLTQSISSFIGFLLILGLIFFSYWLEVNYKKFYWYKSGKIGIVGLITILVILVIRLMVAQFDITVLSFTEFETLLSGLFLIVVLTMIYFLNKSND